VLQIPPLRDCHNDAPTDMPCLQSVSCSRIFWWSAIRPGTPVPVEGAPDCPYIVGCGAAGWRRSPALSSGPESGLSSILFQSLIKMRKSQCELIGLRFGSGFRSSTRGRAETPMSGVFPLAANRLDGRSNA